MRRIKLSSLAVLSLVLTYQPVNAQVFATHGESRAQHEEEPFIDTGNTSLKKSFDDFNDSLDRTGRRMKSDYESSLQVTAHRNAIEAQTNLTDTNKVLNDSYQNTQAQALNSGGLYNTPGGINYGGYGYGGAFAAPNMNGRYYSSVPRTGSGLYRGSSGGRRH